MSHPRHVLCLAVFPSPISFLRESGLSRLRVMMSAVVLIMYE